MQVIPVIPTQEAHVDENNHNIIKLISSIKPDATTADIAQPMSPSTSSHFDFQQSQEIKSLLQF